MIVKATFHVIPKRVNQLKELVASLGASIALEGETTFEEIDNEQGLRSIGNEVGLGDGREDDAKDAGNDDSGLGLAADENGELAGTSGKDATEQSVEWDS